LNAEMPFFSFYFCLYALASLFETKAFGVFDVTKFIVFEKKILMLLVV